MNDNLGIFPGVSWGELHSEFLDSIAGWLCADCHARLTGAARELMALRVAYGKQKAGSNEKEIL